MNKLLQQTYKLYIIEILWKWSLTARRYLEYIQERSVNHEIDQKLYCCICHDNFSHLYTSNVIRINWATPSYLYQPTSCTTINIFQHSCKFRTNVKELKHFNWSESNIESWYLTWIQDLLPLLHQRFHEWGNEEWNTSW